MASSSSSQGSDSSSFRIENLEDDSENDKISILLDTIHRLKNRILAERLVSIKERIKQNKKILKASTVKLFDLASENTYDKQKENMLTFRLNNPLSKINECENYREFGENNQEEGGAVRLIKLPFVEKISPYTTWIFLDKNQRMADDQSVVGRRRIYYDPCGNETLICSDSDEEIPLPEEEKHEFTEGEDQILWKVLHDHGTSLEALDVLNRFIEATPSEIEERYETIIDKYQQKPEKSLRLSEGKPFLDKTLSEALDSFDTLFCRRCLVFDCRLHGCSQSLVTPCEKQSYGIEPEESRKPCGEYCFLKRKEVQNLSHDNSQPSDTPTNSTSLGKSTENLEAEKICAEMKSLLVVSKGNEGNSSSSDTSVQELSAKICSKRKVLIDESKNSNSADKKQKITASRTDDSDKKESTDELCESLSKKDSSDAGLNNLSILGKAHGSLEWSTMEKDLYLKGIEIFGKNSCLISRNLLSGLKTCTDVSNYMLNGGAMLLNRSTSKESSGIADHDYLEQDIPTRNRSWRRRGRSKKLKYTWKSTGHPSFRKRIIDGKHRSCTQYTPCGCVQMCGKECPCQLNGNCCEKYCGCSKNCKNRFRGCHCAKSQCRSRQCPCFAAGRECDPDVCRNCWVSCGDGTFAEPPSTSDGYQCGNMKLLLKQQQRILLAKSDVAGWGAFLKNPVNKNDYLGEYTGELISHKEADKRGKIYDRANSSFLFDLNDQYVLDAYRKGDKLKFANHSSNPNCYAKVMLVAGDHRVGIFAKEHIEASEELFYDYRYGPDQAPAWARKPEGSKRDDPSASHSRAHKVA